MTPEDWTDAEFRDLDEHVATDLDQSEWPGPGDMIGAVRDFSPVRPCVGAAPGYRRVSLCRYWASVLIRSLIPMKNPGIEASPAVRWRAVRRCTAPVDNPVPVARSAATSIRTLVSMKRSRGCSW
jgi:hypothetical protein